LQAYSESETQGLQTYRDTYETNSESGKVDIQYLFGQLIFGTARVFPCFDQPDLKAPLSVTVVTHEEWQLASNG